MEKLNSSSNLRLYKQNMMLKFVEIKSNEPKLRQKQNSKQLGHSDRTIKGHRDDINMDSLYNTKKYWKKKNQNL